MASKTSTSYTSKGIVGTVKLGHTDMSILRSMCSGTKKHKTYNMKQAPAKGNEAVAEKRRAKKKALRAK